MPRGPSFLPPPDGSRDPRIDDPTNRWLIHLLGRLLLPLALRFRVSANAVSVTGLILGAAAAWSYLDWRDENRALLGFLLCIAWLIADGLDGMIARATATASPLGRILDGLCDHGVFCLLYVALAHSIGTWEAWGLGALAGIAHAVQSTLYEGERVRFHRRRRGDPGEMRRTISRNPLVRLYDAVALAPDRWSEPFDAMLRNARDPERVGRIYCDAAVPALKPMWALSANMRILAIFLACLAGNPLLFFWLELVPLSLVLVIGLLWHRNIEKRMVRAYGNGRSTSAAFDPPPTHI
ncbi:CDP-alcohol phosphatidyltransferase family protein [Sphingosinicella rhizophila]|uniref:CDP-alcohol phosphatidyltransferase family protein n=1 Tax=Sphingosinicella rhizophila TaxID=3050082 RepID=A0ABU3QBK6_9SPHN|nr:CDP-alcohol phosphatidyltransferase family protein [Sphingosinicella sp. GR2756]MDT9600758.1 CDP-alcohol phosphatidyltransferase family protein [Sphingosinicella sp. GR2756]